MTTTTTETKLRTTRRTRRRASALMSDTVRDLMSTTAMLKRKAGLKRSNIGGNLISSVILHSKVTELDPSVNTNELTKVMVSAEKRERALRTEAATIVRKAREDAEKKIRALCYREIKDARVKRDLSQLPVESWFIPFTELAKYTQRTCKRTRAMKE